MQKPQTLDRQGLAVDKFSTIVFQTATTNQVFLEISKHVKRRNFTNALELLEGRGIAGDTAFFLLASIHHMGAQR